MLHWIFHALFVLAVCAIIGMFGYGDIYLYRALAAAQAQVVVLTKERASDVASANARAITRTADLRDAVTAGIAIGRIAAPRPRSPGAPQPVVTADQIAEAIR